MKIEVQIKNCLSEIKRNKKDFLFELESIN